MIEEKDVSCAKCRYWKRIDDVRGECHRYPKPLGKAFLEQWTQTNADDWCGEFAASEQKTTTEKTNGKATGSKKRQAVQADEDRPVRR